MRKQVALFSALLFVAFAIGLLIPSGQGSTAVADSCITGTCYVNHAAGGSCRTKYIPWREIWSRHLSNSPTACCGTHVRDECLEYSELPPIND